MALRNPRTIPGTRSREAQLEGDCLCCVSRAKARTRRDLPPRCHRCALIPTLAQRLTGPDYVNRRRMHRRQSLPPALAARAGAPQRRAMPALRIAALRRCSRQPKSRYKQRLPTKTITHKSIASSQRPLSFPQQTYRHCARVIFRAAFTSVACRS